MYPGMRSLSVSPQESEISLKLSTKDFPENVGDPGFRPCDFSFKLSPRLQFSNEKWMIGLKGLTIPNRLKNINASFQILILAGPNVQTVKLPEACLRSPKSITEFLNQQISSQTSYTSNIKFGVTTSAPQLVTCQVADPGGVNLFMVTFTPNLCLMLGFDTATIVRSVSIASRL